MEDEVMPLENLPARRVGHSKTLQAPALRGLRVDTNASKAFVKWHELRLESKGPSTRSHCAGCVYKDKLYILGGEDLQEGPRTDLFVYTFKSGSVGWEEITLKGPFPRGVSYSASVESDGILYIFGGLSLVNPVNDLIAINLETYECSVIEQKGFWPPAISSHSAVINPETKKLYVYGGLVKHLPTSNIYEYDIATSVWTKVSVAEPFPPPRSSHACAYHAGSIIVYGGVNKDGDFLNDLWIFSLTDLTWKNVEFAAGEAGPTARQKHSMVAHNGMLFVFGGQLEEPKETNEMWGFDLAGGAWTKVHDSHQSDDPLESDTPNTALRNHAKNKNNKTMRSTMKVNTSFGKKSSPPAAQTTSSSMAKSSSMTTLKTTKKKKQWELPPFTEEQKVKHNVDEPASPVSMMMTNSIVLKCYAKKPVKDIYQGPEMRSRGDIAGRVPCARDGHFALVYNDKMLVFGGDRNKISFGDLHYFMMG